MRRRIDEQRAALLAALERLVTRRRRLLSSVQVRFAALDWRAQIGRLRRALDERSTELRLRAERLLVAKRRLLQAAALRLDERSPLRILERGYAIAYDSSGKVLRSVEQVALGEDIDVQLHRGRVSANVTKKS